MTLTRIRFSTSLAATGDAYTLRYNPAEVNLQDSLDGKSIQILHGAAVIQRSYWDGRPRTLKWAPLPADTSKTTAFYDMINEINSYIGEIRYVNFGDIQIINWSWPTSASWKKCRIIDVKTEMRKGGRLIYDNVELTIQPEVA